MSNNLKCFIARWPFRLSRRPIEYLRRFPGQSDSSPMKRASQLKPSQEHFSNHFLRPSSILGLDPAPYFKTFSNAVRLLYQDRTTSLNSTAIQHTIFGSSVLLASIIKGICRPYVLFCHHDIVKPDLADVSRRGIRDI